PPKPVPAPPPVPATSDLLGKALDGAFERACQRFQGPLQSSRHADNRLPFSGLGDSTLDDPRAGFKHFGEFALAVRDACQPGKRPDDRLALITKTASGMGENTGADGGFLVPSEFVQKILERVYATSNLLGMTDS